MEIKFLQDITASADPKGATTKLYKKNNIYNVYDRLANILIDSKKAIEVVDIVEIDKIKDLEKINKKQFTKKLENKKFKKKISNK